MSDPTNSDFARLDDRVRRVEPMAQQLARVDGKLDALNTALAALVRFEERQANQAEKFRELAVDVANNRNQAEQRAAAMGERFDDRITDLEKAHQVVSAELHGYVQRYMGITAAVSGFCVLLGGVWAVVSKFVP